MLKRDEATNASSCWNKGRNDERVFVLLARDEAAPHAIREWASRRGGPDRLDVTRKSAGPDGIAFAPSYRILGPVLLLRRHDDIGFERAWPRYAMDYIAEMRASYRDQRAVWDALLARSEVTLVCYCTNMARCHRTVLAEILGKLGATVRGERAR